MKIAIICHDLSGGGAERVVAIVASGLAKKQHSVHIFIEHDRRENAAYLDPSVELTVLKGKSRVARIWSLVKYLRAGGYDVVHTINPLLTVQTLMVRRCADLERAALIGSYHGLFAQFHGILGRASYFFTPVITRLADKTICVSNALKADLIGRWGASQDNLVTIYNPVAVVQRPVASTRETDELPAHYVLFAGRLTRDKNPALALKALALLPQTLSSFSLVVLGVGPLRNDLEQLAERLKIRERVCFVGYVTHPWIFYQNAKAFVSTSDAEAFGLVIVEALAYGVPVVATKSGGPQEILDDGRFGSLVDTGDERALASALIHAINAPPPRDALRARAAEYNVDRSTDAYERLFSQTIAERRASGKPAQADMLQS